MGEHISNIITNPGQTLHNRGSFSVRKKRGFSQNAARLRKPLTNFIEGREQSMEYTGGTKLAWC